MTVLFFHFVVFLKCYNLLCPSRTLIKKAIFTSSIGRQNIQFPENRITVCLEMKYSEAFHFEHIKIFFAFNTFLYIWAFFRWLFSKMYFIILHQLEYYSIYFADWFNLSVHCLEPSKYP